MEARDAGEFMEAVRREDDDVEGSEEQVQDLASEASDGQQESGDLPPDRAACGSRGEDD